MVRPLGGLITGMQDCGPCFRDFKETVVLADPVPFQSALELVTLPHSQDL